MPITTEVRLREIFLRDDRYLSLRLEEGTPAGELAGHRILELGFPEQTLVATVRRDGATIVPRGSTELLEGDRLLVLGEPPAIRDLEQRFGLGDLEADATPSISPPDGERISLFNGRDL